MIMIKRISLVTAIIFLTIFSCDSYPQDFIPIKFGVITPNYKEDNLHGEQEKDFGEAALNYAIGESSNTLHKCGYQLSYLTYYIDNTDSLSAKEGGEYIKSKNVWFIIGPNRSDLFLLTLNGSKSTPAISLMAGADAVTHLKPPIFSMYPSSKQIAAAAVNIVEEKNLGHHYGVFLDATCNSCIDFSKYFDAFSKNKLSKEFSIETTDDNPDIAKLLKTLETNKIDFLLLPNFSKLSGNVMAAVHQKFPNIKFLGSDGWGSEDHSFITDNNLPNDIVAYCVRVGMPSKKLASFYHVYSLDKEWGDRVVSPSIANFLTIELLRKISSQLCETKPKSKEEFYRYLEKQNTNVFKTKIGISLYKIRDSKPIFENSV
jgi:hypothetical protein